MASTVARKARGVVRGFCNHIEKSNRTIGNDVFASNGRLFVTPVRGTFQDSSPARTVTNRVLFRDQPVRAQTLETWFRKQRRPTHHQAHRPAIESASRSVESTACTANTASKALTAAAQRAIPTGVVRPVQGRVERRGPQPWVAFALGELHPRLFILDRFAVGWNGVRLDN